MMAVVLSIAAVYRAPGAKVRELSIGIDGLLSSW
jgi:hypothetical protein